MALFRYGFKRKYVGFRKGFCKDLHVQLAVKLFYLKTFMVYDISFANLSLRGQQCIMITHVCMCVTSFYSLTLSHCESHINNIVAIYHSL